MLAQNSIQIRKITAVILFMGSGILLMSALSETGILGDEQKSLENILQQVARYRDNENTDAILELDDHIRRHRQTPEGRESIEAQLLAQLEKGATPDGQWEILRHLSSLGTAASVPFLQKLLMEEGRSDLACYTLEKIDGPEAEKALISSLDSLDGKARLGIISSLGHRKSLSAVSDLVDLAGKADQVTVEAVVNALGNIASAEAAQALLVFLESKGARFQTLIADALLRCADSWHASGETEQAGRLYRRIVNSEISAPATQAAFQGLVRTAGDNAPEMILDALQSPVLGLASAAAVMLPQAIAAPDLGSVCELFPRLPAQNQVYLITALSRYDSDLARVTVIGNLAHPELEVRMAALKALEKLGNASTVQILARHTARTRGSEQDQARLTLGNLKGKSVDDALLKALNREIDPGIATELIRSVGERRIILGKSLLYARMQDADSDVRIQSIRALSRLTEPADLSSLLELLLQIENEAEQNELATAVAVTARKITRLHAQADLVTRKLSESERASDRSILISVLSRIGDDSALPAVRLSLQDANEKVRESAARALTGWPTSTARDDVFWLAQSSVDATIQVLAVRAYVRMVEGERFRLPEAAVASLEAVLPLVRRPEEKMLVLATLPRFPCQKALGLAESFLKDSGVQKEAQAAVDRLRRMLH